ncbi:hypothetical protein SCOR_06415 [Sulfidibacter corallicola]|uniref:Uncharacterized protein n=1 Tax=Sulfidibacter corallicola TaxID=2818388 RepID=A0A8A4TNP5_SULCO|nr:hypothetical protein [Sulfidibacter corallicola]QTD51599.1 hypothetical protein J3U87_03940 [Sulfidibacter corallicola]
MEYYLIDCLGDSNNLDLAFIDEDPDEIAEFGFRLTFGERMGDKFPEDAKIPLSEKQKGIQLLPFLGNSKRRLICNPDLTQLIKGMVDWEIEYLPFTLLNHRGRVHSADYQIINPIGAFDCLNMKATGGQLDDQDRLYCEDELVLDPKKLEQAPHLFRIKHAAHNYVASEAFLDACDDRGIRNLFADELEQQPAS